MADNIKIVGNVNNIQRISRFKAVDTNLLSINNLPQNFGYEGDFIELFIYDNNNNLLSVDYNYTDYKLPTNKFLYTDNTLPEIQIDPTLDIENSGYNSGIFKSQYSFFRRKFSSSNIDLFISEISEDRTEIRVNSINISSSDLIQEAQNLINELTSVSYQKYYIANFNIDIQQTVINVAIDNTTDIPSILFKLYEPLSVEVSEKDTLWITEEITEPYVFGINLDISIIPSPLPQLRGPNFDIELDIKQNIATGYQTYSSLISSLTGSSYYKILNYMNDNSYDLNIDYTAFENFIHFSSAKKRLEIFYDKINQIENYNTDIDTLLSSTSILKNTETASIKLKIDNITKNFDGFENYLYFESSSYSWPKTNNIKPYKNKFINKQFTQISSSTIWNFTHSLNEIPQVVSIYSGSGQLLTTQSSTVGLNTISLTFNSSVSGYAVLTSPSASAWYTSYSTTASLYDQNNLDHLYNIIPEYIKNDPNNYQPYYNFIDMIGHYFDNIWIYITSINELYNADNNLEKGVSKDIVYDALKSLGIKLYNSKGNDEFNNYIDGLNSGSILFNDDFSVTSSYLNNIPKKDLLAETYKRIYHNLILLNKGKGTSVGLQNLITTFGITSSILSPKEFGGSTKRNEIKGYDNDKITIQNNTITGSILSPFISLQNPISSSLEFTSTDLHFVDLSFSPQNELNKRISSSIALINPTFSLDDYIGDPRLMESSSYDALITQQNYFTSASSAVSGSAKRLDYKGFIELIKYFDNSLFKMLKDFAPARANTLTGVTIKSPILERNKIKTYKPKVTEEIIYDAEYIAPVISEDKDYYYDKIGGNKSSFYTGELTGSYANINDVFENSNPNPYLHPTKSVNINEFNHTDFNITLNNISSSVLSSIRKKVEPLYVLDNNKVLLTSSINRYEYTSSAELQDSYDSLLGHNRSRYEGTKLTSLTYNTYSSASFVYDGDISYGKTAVIDHNTKKLGLFTQITNNQFFQSFQRSNIALKYLVDEKGNLTELNKRNKHWNEIQNTFKSGESLIISLFDNQNPSNQKRTDGIKSIYNSGYNYTPMLYLTGSADKLFFAYSGEDTAKLFTARNILNGYISGSTSPIYPLKPSGSAKVIYNIFDNIISNDNSVYTAGSSTSNTFPSYSVISNGNYVFNTSFDLNLQFQSTNQSCSFKYDIIKGGIDGSGFPTGSTPGTSGIIATSGIKTFTTSYTVTQFGRGNNYNSLPSFTYSDSSYSIPDSFSPLTLFDGSSNKIVTLTWSGTTNVFTGDDSNTYYLVLGTWSFDAGGGYFPSFTKLILTTSNDSNMNSTDYILTSANSSEFTNNTIGTLSFNVNSSGDDLIKGDRIYFKLSLLSTTTSNFTASFATVGELKNNLTTNIAGNAVYATGSTTDSFIACAISSSTSNIDTLVLNAGLSAFNNYTFLPTTGSSDLLKLYSDYGDVSDSFSPTVGDVIVTYWGGQSTEFSISNIFTSGSYKCLTLNKSLPSSLATKINDGSDTTYAGVDKLILLKKNSDETNILLNFTKPSGSTSLGFIIPNNLHPDVLNNIDTITKEVKQKLINFNSPSGSI